MSPGHRSNDPVSRDGGGRSHSARLHVPRRVASAGRLRNADLRLLLLGFAALTLSEWSYVTALSIRAFRVGGTLAVGLIGLRLLAGGLSSALISPLAAYRKHVNSLRRTAPSPASNRAR